MINYAINRHGKTVQYFSPNQYFSLLTTTRLGRVGLSTFGMAGQKALNVMVGVVSIALLLPYLGEVKFGLLMAITTFGQWFLIDIGINQAMKMQLITASARGDTQSEHQIISTAFFSSLALMFILSLLVVPIMSLIDLNVLFNISTSYLEATTRKSVYIAIALTFCNIPFLLVREVYSARQEGYIYSLWACLASVLYLIGVLVSVYFALDLPSVVAFVLATQVFGNIFASIYLIYRQPEMYPCPGMVSISLVHRLVRTSLQFGVIGISWIAIHSTDIMIVNYFLGQSEATIYAVTSRLFSYFASLLSFVTFPFWPAIGNAREQKDFPTMRIFSRRLLGICFISAVTGNLLLCFASYFVIPVWTRGQVESSWSLLVALSIWFVLRNFADTATTILNGLGWIKGQVYLTLAQAVLHLGLCIALAPIYGIIGVVSGATFALLLTRGLLLGIMVWRETANLNLDKTI